MYNLMWQFKFLPPGRGLWAMGADVVYERGSSVLLNCGAISTQDIKLDYSAPFRWLMDMSMSGIGIGYDTKGAGTVTILPPAKKLDAVYLIPDSREGWVEIAGIILDAYTGTGYLPTFDYSQIRPKGSPLRTTGGIAPGPQPLIDLVNNLTRLYDNYIGKKVDSTLIVDTCNYLGKAVVSGGIRRSALISFGEHNDREFMALKLDQAAVLDRRFASNNSIITPVGMDYAYPASLTAQNGEPGYFWLENARAYSRLIDLPDWKDERAMMTNPCAEQVLENAELCCLVETFPAKHESLIDNINTLK